MKKSNMPWIALAAILLLIWIAGWSIIAFLLWNREASVAKNEAQDYVIRFGILGTNSAGDYFVSQETTTIPLKYKDSGFRYGLEIVSADDNSFTYQCVFHFSAAPKVLTGDAFDTTEPSTTLRTPKTQAQGNAIEFYWFDPGDPVGDQSIDVIINDKLVKTIKYTVVPQN